jgi:hypothetical protein
VYTITGWIETQGTAGRRVLSINGINGSTTTQLASAESTSTSSVANTSATAIARLTAGEGVRFQAYNGGAADIKLGLGDTMSFSIVFDGTA